MRSEILFQNRKAVFLQHTGRHLWMPEEIFKHHLGAIAAFVPENMFQIRIAYPVDQTPQLHPDHRAAAHEAWLTAGIHLWQPTARQKP